MRVGLNYGVTQFSKLTGFFWGGIWGGALRRLSRFVVRVGRVWSFDGLRMMGLKRGAPLGDRRLPRKWRSLDFKFL